MVHVAKFTATVTAIAPRRFAMLFALVAVSPTSRQDATYEVNLGSAISPWYGEISRPRGIYRYLGFAMCRRIYVVHEVRKAIP